MRILPNVVLSLCFAAPSACSPAPPPTEPDLLEDATVRGNWWNFGCPWPDGISPPAEQEQDSPEIRQRLEALFPPGSNGKDLHAFLVSHGFQDFMQCQDDGKIRGMRLQQARDGSGGPYPATADVAWKDDGDGQVVWIKATIAWTGP